MWRLATLGSDGRLHFASNMRYNRRPISIIRYGWETARAREWIMSSENSVEHQILHRSLCSGDIDDKQLTLFQTNTRIANRSCLLSIFCFLYLNCVSESPPPIHSWSKQIFVSRKFRTLFSSHIFVLVIFCCCGFTLYRRQVYHASPFHSFHWPRMAFRISATISYCVTNVCGEVRR